MSATLKVSIYENQIALFSFEQIEQINNGQYPIHFAKDGKYEYKLVSEAELELYTNYDPTDEDLPTITELHRFAPVVWDGQDTGGVPHKELNHTNENTETVDEETI
jgi:hypothetical protein